MKGILLFLKGMLMGVCDLIPGISGGTIAFITGIYSRLIEAVKSFSPKLLKDILRYLAKRDKQNFSNLREAIKKLDLVFLLTLLGGIGTSILLGSRLISYLLEYHFSLTISFFIGLILSSSVFIFTKIESHELQDIFFGVVGLGSGILLALLMPADIKVSYAYVFFGGFVSISAMFLPGISGAFILLIMGLYRFMIDEVLHNVIENLAYLAVFLIGAIFGAFSISRIISFLFRTARNKTLYFLTGLVIGALAIPVKKIFEVETSFSLMSVLAMVGLALLGVILVWLVNSKDGKRG
jgi:putative membrane protein